MCAPPHLSAEQTQSCSSLLSSSLLQVKVISQQELVFAKEKGATIIDIRPAGEYESGHIKDSVNVSLFQLITG